MFAREVTIDGNRYPVISKHDKGCINIWHTIARLIANIVKIAKCIPLIGSWFSSWDIKNGDDGREYVVIFQSRTQDTQIFQENVTIIDRTPSSHQPSPLEKFKKFIASNEFKKFIKKYESDGLLTDRFAILDLKDEIEILLTKLPKNPDFSESQNIVTMINKFATLIIQYNYKESSLTSTINTNIQVRAEYKRNQSAMLQHFAPQLKRLKQLKEQLQNQKSAIEEAQQKKASAETKRTLIESEIPRLRESLERLKTEIDALNEGLKKPDVPSDLKKELNILIEEKQEEYNNASETRREQLRDDINALILDVHDVSVLQILIDKKSEILNTQSSEIVKITKRFVELTGVIQTQQALIETLQSKSVQLENASEFIELTREIEEAQSQAKQPLSDCGTSLLDKQRAQEQFQIKILQSINVLLAAIAASKEAQKTPLQEAETLPIPSQTTTVRG